MDFIIEKSLKKWWCNATEKEKEEVRMKRLITLKNNGKICNITKLMSKEDLKDKINYYQKVWYETNKTYRNNIEELDPKRLRGRKYHLDHKYSCIKDWINHIPPEIIGSLCNLEIITQNENLKKYTKCKITKYELLEGFKYEKEMENKMEARIF